MHILFMHRQFPAQFGQVARHLVQRGGYECTFVCERASSNAAGSQVQFVPDFAAGNQIGMVAAAAAQGYPYTSFPPPSAAQPPDDDVIDGIRRIQYSVNDPTPGLESLLLHLNAFCQTLKAHPEIRPDLVVGPCLYASSLFLQDLYRCPVLNYFDYYFKDSDSYINFRPDFPATDYDILRARAHNALLYPDLHSCTAGYSPTAWQRSLLPAEYQGKVSTIFDGIDRGFWYRRPVERRILGGPYISPDTRIVTYVARGLEALRGFDIFMRVAKRICDVRSNVHFVVVGSEHFYHGADLNYIQEPSFLQHVLRQDYYDLSRFTFAGRIPSSFLVDILSLSDLHIYLSAPFVLSWSLFDAMACGCTVLGSDTSPVREVLQHERNSLLADFFDVDALTRLALEVIDDPQRFQPLAQAAVQLIDDKYSLEKVTPQMVDLFERTVSA
jgi:glycosyltransferase involved in cell wall biosynthesis